MDINVSVGASGFQTRPGSFWVFENQISSRQRIERDRFDTILS
jgi:hypothetical protein